ncbi:MAG: DUF6883 domain-containing protein, partial [Thermodesulfobacteriota bacterium]
FAYFYEKGLDIINRSGLMGYISNTFDKTTAGKVLRNFINENASIERYIDFTQVQIFEGATTYPVIIILNEKLNQNSQFLYKKVPKIQQSKVIDIDYLNGIQVLQNTLKPESWSFLEKNKALLFEKLLGFTKDNYDRLLQQLENKALQTEAAFHSEDKFGKRYTVDIMVEGLEKKTALVRTGWIIPHGSKEAKLATLYIQKPGRR